MKLIHFARLFILTLASSAIVFSFQNCSSSSGFTASPSPTPSPNDNDSGNSGDTPDNTSSSGPSISLVAGGISGAGNIDGPLSSARFYMPKSAVVDSKGNTFIVAFSEPTIRRLSASGDVTVFAGRPNAKGNEVGTSSNARFGTIGDIAIDSADNLYVTDLTYCLIKKITPQGDVSIVSGFLNSCGFVNGSVSTAKFSNSMYGIVVDSSGNIFVSERNFHIIRKISPSGEVSTYAGAYGLSGNSNGNSSDARFKYPEDLTFDFEGNLFVSDAGNREIRKILQTGLVSKYAGNINSSSFSGALSDVNLGSVGNLYWKSPSELFYSSNFSFFKVTNNSSVSVFSGAESPGLQNGDASTTLFGGTFGFTYNHFISKFIVLDTSNHVLRLVDLNGNSFPLAGSPESSGDMDGSYNEARFSSIGSMAINSRGEVYILDKSVFKIKMMDKDGLVSTVYYSITDLQGADSIAFDSLDNLYISNSSQHIILKREPTGVVSVFSGQRNTSGFQDGSIGSSLFYTPMGLAIDSDDNIYVADRNNNRIRKITPSGSVQTLAVKIKLPNSNQSILETPTQIALGPDRSLYFVESGKQWIGKVSTSGEVTLISGNPWETGELNGNLESARFNSPISLSVDSAGSIYVVDSKNYMIRKIQGNAVTTYAGLSGYFGSKVGPLPSPIGFVTSVLYNGERLLYSDGSTVYQIK